MIVITAAMSLRILPMLPTSFLTMPRWAPPLSLESSDRRSKSVCLSFSASCFLSSFGLSCGIPFFLLFDCVLLQPEVRRKGVLECYLDLDPVESQLEQDIGGRLRDRPLCGVTALRYYPRSVLFSMRPIASEFPCDRYLYARRTGVHHVVD